MADTVAGAPQPSGLRSLIESSWKYNVKPAKTSELLQHREGEVRKINSSALYIVIVQCDIADVVQPRLPEAEHECVQLRRKEELELVFMVENAYSLVVYLFVRGQDVET